MNQEQRASPGGAGAQWASNATLEQIADRLRAAASVVVTTHSKPDGDAVGATLALARSLNRCGGKATVLYLDPWSSIFDPFIADTPVIHEHRNVWAEPALADPAAVAIVDTGSWNQLADARAWLEPRADRTVVIDHHVHGNPEVASMRCIDPAASSACELVAEVCLKLLGLQRSSELPLDIAEALYLGIATDTGWFRFSNTSAKAMHLAAELLEAGARHSMIYQAVEQNDKPARLKLMARALEHLEFLDHGRIAMMTIAHRDIVETGATMEDAGGMSDIPNCVGSVRVVAVLTELAPSLTKLSLRSKPGAGAVDVNRMAQRFGGGGHFHAAGAKIPLPLREAADAVARALTDGTP